jgi:hypothetical protein
MKIPAEILTPYLTEVVDKPSADNQGPEPVAASARLGGTATSLESNQPRAPIQESDAIEDRRREPRTRKVKHHSGEERRKENRRKETFAILLDTRTSQNRRESGPSSSIDLKI